MGLAIIILVFLSRIAIGATPHDCICPFDETIVANPGTQSCGQIKCPACGTNLVRVTYIGNQLDVAAFPQVNVNTGAGALTGNAANTNNTAGTGAGAGADTTNTPVANAAAMGMPMYPMMHPTLHRNAPVIQNLQNTQAQSQNNTATSAVTYTNTISGIVEINCLRCHGGPLRNLTNYKNVKAYADSGLLKLMVQQGGPMNRFSGKDSQTIIDWIKAGAPE